MLSLIAVTPSSVWSTHEKRPSDRDLLNEPMVRTRAVRYHYTLGYDLRAVDAAHVAAMVIGHFGHFEVLVAFVGAIGNPPIVLPIADTVFAADIDAMIVRFKNHVSGSNLGPDHVVEQTVVEEISLKRSHAREILLLPLLQKSAALFIRHGHPIVGHKQHPYLIILSKLILASATALPATLTVRGDGSERLRSRRASSQTSPGFTSPMIAPAYVTVPLSACAIYLLEFIGGNGVK